MYSIYLPIRLKLLSEKGCELLCVMKAKSKYTFLEAYKLLISSSMRIYVFICHGIIKYLNHCRMMADEY
jgi:hypothetical protein